MTYIPNHLIALVVLLETQRRLVALIPPRWGMTELVAVECLPRLDGAPDGSDSCARVARPDLPPPQSSDSLEASEGGAP